MRGHARVMLDGPDPRRIIERQPIYLVPFWPITLIEGTADQEADGWTRAIAYRTAVCTIGPIQLSGGREGTGKGSPS